ncbi:MAG: CAP domain-containing protein [Isosphaeraceae bacterium]
MRTVFMTSLSAIVMVVTAVAARSLGQETFAKDQSPDSVAAALIEAHNKVRAEAKLPPMKANSKLTQAALDHARDMAEHNNLSHEGSDGSDVARRVKKRGYRYLEIGENIADGQVTVPEVMHTWLNSPPHKENLLADFSEIGVAIVPDGSGRKYWCADFGRPLPKIDTAKGPAALVAALNRARTDARRSTVKMDPKLTQVADRFARDLAARRKVDTKNRDGQTPFDILKRQSYHARQFGLSLASGESDPAKVVASCLERVADREQMLASFNRVGVAVAVDEDGVPYWVVILAQSR